MSPSPKFWNKVAPKYAKSPIKNEAAYVQKIERTKNYLTPESRVLELGCGTGTTALKLAPFAQHIMATDLATAMIEIAKEKQQSQAVENVSFDAMEVSEALAQSGPVDMIMAMSLLHLVENRQETLQAIYDKLDSGGIFVSSTACLKGAFPLIGSFLKLGHFFGVFPYVASFSTAQLKKEFEAVGFEILEDFQPRKIEAIFMVCRKP